MGRSHVAGGTASSALIRLRKVDWLRMAPCRGAGRHPQVVRWRCGTVDFSLIAVTDVAGQLELERISVGEHILLGGDNMDLALAYTLQARLEAEGKSPDAWQFLALVHAAARAKITLFEDLSLAEAPDRGSFARSSLFGKTISLRRRSRLAVPGHPRRVLRADRARRSAAARHSGLACGNSARLTRPIR